MCWRLIHEAHCDSSSEQPWWDRRDCPHHQRNATFLNRCSLNHTSTSPPKRYTSFHSSKCLAQQLQRILILPCLTMIRQQTRPMVTAHSRSQRKRRHIRQSLSHSHSSPDHRHGCWILPVPPKKA